MNAVSGRDLWVRGRQAVSTLGWFWRGVTGADAYERYVDHLQRHHPDQPVPSEKQFWRDKYAEMDRNPKARCC
ncbi:YbdD/YjiX family protein [Austwickia sp. TVS 96-490-7B]|uniref:YbdD/YjiX family protein n=1 Tax=Austwickia sp. TVS 96-490-7B TaxID=2830843 RepID=UPI002103589F|nr:YbdD/YjiX family protein [Austwickia sp. TVS 96-490-7B]